jgi:hypothetical protein
MVWLNYTFILWVWLNYTMNKRIEIEDYQEMDEELHKIQKAIRMVWRQQQKGLIDEWVKEDLK